MTSTKYPFDADGPLCPLLDDGTFLVDVYTASGNRPSIKAFIKKTKWAGKPKVGISVGEAQLVELLPNLFNSPEARDKLGRAGQKSGKTAAAPLHQAIWAWFQDVDGDTGTKLKEHCHERGDGLYFLTADAVAAFAAELAATSPDAAAVERAGRVILAFAMLQPADALSLARAFVERFPALVDGMGLQRS